MTSKLSLSLVVVATAFIVLFSACKKDDPNVAIWTLSNVEGNLTTVSQVGANLVTITHTKSYAAGTLRLGYTNSFNGITDTVTYSDYSLILSIQKGGLLTITESGTSNVPGSVKTVNTMDSYWNYWNNTANKDEITLTGISHTRCCFGDKFKITQSNRTLTLVYNTSSATLTGNEVSSTITNTLTFTK